MLMMLDLMAAFDSVDQLKKSCGLTGSAFGWFTSYVIGHSEHVICGATMSSPSAVFCGVLLCSVLGPILYLLYAADLLQLIRHHHVIPHAYADDVQICGSCSEISCNVK